jgi:hypothetical protein
MSGGARNMASVFDCDVNVKTVLVALRQTGEVPCGRSLS